MELWIHWFRCVLALRRSCARQTTFMWMTLALVGFSVRAELLGVTSFIRAAFLDAQKYRRLLHLFHTPALDLHVLTHLWVSLALRLFHPVTFQGHLITIADGLKVPKEGKKMPAVKSLHQSSENNSKPAFIMGHSFQMIALLAIGPLGRHFAVPLASRIHEGVVWCNRHRKTLLDKLISLFLPIADLIGKPTILLADAYYASYKIAKPLLKTGHHLVTRVKKNSVAYHPAAQPKKRRRGRPKIYGKKVRLRDYWKQKRAFTKARSPVYDEAAVEIEYLVKDLLWRPLGCLVRFVLVKHPTRGRMILMTTLLSLEPLEIIQLYGYRFKIEVGFKQALHTLGAYSYHFWMKDMVPIRRGAGNQYMHRQSYEYREAVKRKIGAYHRYVQLACIAQGILQFLAIKYRPLVWKHFNSWLRTMKIEKAPSEMVVAQALRSTLPEFLVAKHDSHDLEKFIAENADLDRLPQLSLTG